MSIYDPIPEKIAAFRDTTERNSGKMVNAQYNTFLCKFCGKQKRTAGRKEIGWKMGYKCADCVEGKNG